MTTTKNRRTPLPTDRDALLDQMMWELLPLDFRRTSGRLPSTWIDEWAGYNPYSPVDAQRVRPER